MSDINSLLKLTQDKKASDLHITAGKPPILRINGELTVTDLPVLTKEKLKVLIYSMLSDEHKTIFEQDKELDCRDSYVFGS